MITAIALDDEPLALKVLESFCSRHENLELVKTFTDPDKAARYLRKFPVDLIFLDINMPSITGTAFYQALQRDLPVIFTTAYAEYAVEGFNLKAVDYLLKPYSYERFDQAMSRLQERYANLGVFEKEDAHFFVRSDYSLVKILYADILFIESLNDYLKIHLKDKSEVVTRMTLINISKKLPAERFVRVHRSFVVAAEKIKSIRNKSIQLADRTIPIGNSYESTFQSFLTESE